MLELILKLYIMYMATDARSPMPHLFGPPGSNKSTAVEHAADLIRDLYGHCTLHIINVSRLSPLDVEGVQMPHGTGEDMVLRMLPATFWTSLKEGDIVLFDEFLRGFPEVYNALLDIFTSRRVGAFILPKVFIIGASNSIVSYDKALEDRLLHLPVPDPRHKKAVKKEMAQAIIDQLGLLPRMVDSNEMMSLLDTEVLPMFDILDHLKNASSSSPVQIKGVSIRNLIGQAKLREVHTPMLKELIAWNNRNAMQDGKPQFVFLTGGKGVDPAYLTKAEKFMRSEDILAKLTDLQKQNLELNLQLVELERARYNKEGSTDDDDESVFEDF